MIFWFGIRDLQLTYLIRGPAAAVDHRSVCHVEVVTKLRVPGIHRGGLRVAAVQLDVVHPPLREGVGVSLEVAQYAGVPTTCQVPVVLVDAKFEAELVDVVSQCRDPTGESFWVGLKFSLWRSDTAKKLEVLTNTATVLLTSWYPASSRQ